MNVAELKAILERLEDLYAAGGATAAAKDFRSIAGLLEGYESKSVDTFIAETRELLDRPKAATTKPSADAGLVVFYSDKLLAAKIDQRRFEAVMFEMDDDKRLGKAEWFGIANRYRNEPTQGTYEFRFRNIQEARKGIRDTFIERHEAASKRGVIERLTKWAS